MHTKSKGTVNKPQRLLDIITPVGYYGATQNIITRKSDKRHHTIIAKKVTTSQDINRNSINRILQYGDKTILSDLVLQLFMSQQYFDKSHFTWDRIEENWKDKLKSRPKTKASLDMKDFKNQCKRWLAKFLDKQWICIKKRSIGIGLYYKKDVLRKDMKQVLKELEAEVWMCDIGTGCNSTTEVNMDITLDFNMSGVGILYCPTLFANHRCGPALRFGHHLPKSKIPRIMIKYRRFNLPVVFVSKGKNQTPNDCLYKANEAKAALQAFSPGLQAMQATVSKSPALSAAARIASSQLKVR